MYHAEKQINKNDYAYCFSDFQIYLVGIGPATRDQNVNIENMLHVFDACHQMAISVDPFLVWNRNPSLLASSKLCSFCLENY
jgi:hypothetical protein